MEPMTYQLLSFMLPEGIFEWFDVTESSKTAETLTITLTEKNIPPLPLADIGKHVESKGFKDITVSDFPIRGRQVFLTFRRRYWQVEGRKELLKRDIVLCAPGTQLEKEFADFLKENGGYESDLSEFYCRIFQNLSP